jgi:hypothetical protein
VISRNAIAACEADARPKIGAGSVEPMKYGIPLVAEGAAF